MTRHAFDAKRAFQHIAALSMPRLVGSAGEAAARAYIAAQLRALGLTVSHLPLSFTKFPAEVLPRLICGLAVPAALAVPWLGDRFPLPVALACAFVLSVALLFTQWRRGFERLYDVGRPHVSENVVATRDGEGPAFLILAHYDSKSQVLPIAVRAIAYAVAIVGLLGVTLAMLLKLLAGVAVPTPALWTLTGVICLCVLLLQINLTQNRSPGAFDNASGVGVMLEVARAVMASDTQKRVTFLATGAEEFGMCGALRYIQRHADAYDPEDTYIINLDGLGVGNGVSLITRYGIPPLRTTRTLADLFSAAGQAVGVQVSERYLPVGVGLDSIPIASRGFETVTLTAREVGQAALKVHSAQDRIDLLTRSSLQAVGDLIGYVLERS